MLCMGTSAWADATLFTAPIDNGDGTYSLNGSTYTKTTYTFTLEPAKGSAASKESASNQANGYTDDATTRYKIGLGGNASVSDMITGLTFTNSNGSIKYIYFCSNYGLQADEGGYVKLTVTGQSERTLAVLHYVTGDNTTTVAGGTTHTIAKKGNRISFTLGNKNASPYYLYTSIDVYEETKVGEFTYDSTTGYYKKNGVNYQRTTYDFGGLYFTNNLASSGGESSTTPSGFAGSSKCTRYKTNSYDTSGTSNLVSGLTFKPSSATAFYYLIGYGWQFDNTVTIKATDADAKTVSYLYYKQGDGVATTDFDAVAENYSTTTGMSTLSMSEKNSSYYIYTSFVVFREAGIGDFYAGGDGYYYTYSDLTGKTTPYARTTYDFSTYNYSSETKTGTAYNPSGFTDNSSNTRYQTTISNGSSNTSVPTGLTFANSSGNAAFLQYYKNMGMQAGTNALTLSIINATSSTVSYLFYKQGAATPTASVAETAESEPVIINGTASTAIELKTLSYKLYTRLEVFTKEVSVTTTAAGKGWATLYTPYPLNFSGVAGLTAYTATVDGSTVTLTPVENVPANTGVVLKSTTINADVLNNIPVIASSTTPQGSLEGSATDVLAYNANDTYNYYMLKLNGSEAQFSKLTGGSIAAGKAYLKIAKTNAPAMFNVVFADDNTTGINTVQGSRFMVNGYYDLQGRKVANPTKGLYIVNGKKVIIK